MPFLDWVNKTQAVNVAFDDSKSVNEALRVIAKLAGKQAKKSAA